jgi:hypothetical protein
MKPQTSSTPAGAAALNGVYIVQQNCSGRQQQLYVYDHRHTTRGNMAMVNHFTSISFLFPKSPEKHISNSVH